MGDVDKSWRSIRDFSLPEYSAYLRRFERADERTRTAYPCSLRVITQALQGFAGDCKYRIFRGVSFLRLAECCTVLRSRWYQSGIKTSDNYSLTSGPIARTCALRSPPVVRFRCRPGAPSPAPWSVPSSLLRPRQWLLLLLSPPVVLLLAVAGLLFH
jgi:hypothetical protein